MFGFGKTREIEAFAKALVAEIATRFPPDRLGEDPMPLARAVDEACNRAKAFRQEKKLGIYGKAQMGTSFKMELKEAGYPDDFVDAVTRQLLLVMSGS